VGKWAALLQLFTFNYPSFVVLNVHQTEENYAENHATCTDIELFLIGLFAA